MPSSHWKRIVGDQPIYVYRPEERPSPGTDRMPVLFLQHAAQETWDALVRLYWQDGFSAIYAYPVTADSDAAALALTEAVEWLFDTLHPDQERLILVGCVEAGLLGRRYVMLGGHKRVAYLFTVGSAHPYSPLAYLRATVVESKPEENEPPPVAAPVLDATLIVNIYGEGLIDAGGVQGVYLPEAVNVALPLGQEALCRDILTCQAMHEYLQGNFWLVTVRLMGLDMRGPLDDDRTGPFCFEVNGQRAPFDGAFRVPVDNPFDFDPARTLLATMPFPLTDEGRAVAVDFRLKDLSPARADTPRRKLVTSLHTPLHAGAISEHALQDSLGSAIRIQVCCVRPHAALETDHD